MKSIVSYFIFIFISFIINSIIYRYQVRREIKNNIDLFIKRHESQVIHEVNHVLFKDDLEVIDEKK